MRRQCDRRLPLPHLLVKVFHTDLQGLGMLRREIYIILKIL